MSWAYAVKSDNDSKNQSIQHPAYALKSDDGKNQKALEQFPSCFLWGKPSTWFNPDGTGVSWV